MINMQKHNHKVKSLFALERSILRAAILIFVFVWPFYAVAQNEKTGHANHRIDVGPKSSAFALPSRSVITTTRGKELFRCERCEIHVFGKGYLVEKNDRIDYLAKDSEPIWSRKAEELTISKNYLFMRLEGRSDTLYNVDLRPINNFDDGLVMGIHYPYLIMRKDGFLHLKPMMEGKAPRVDSLKSVVWNSDSTFEATKFKSFAMVEGANKLENVKQASLTLMWLPYNEIMTGFFTENTIVSLY